MYGAPPCEATDATVTRRPQPRCFIPGTTARVHRNTPVVFTRNNQFQSSSVMRSTGLDVATPALLTRMSISRPSSASVTAVSSATSRTRGVMELEEISSSFTRSRPAAMTVAPWAARSRATARPIPRVAPVTRAVLPLRDMSTPSGRGPSWYLATPQGAWLARRYSTASRYPGIP
ncbi:hypothetical protein BMS3Bbin02_02093 [bacterium BMS3Bbin02]|nr:hypothetical protein BMS3Bbin02_02093 [bacterium BMS3Bbin02]